MPAAIRSETIYEFAFPVTEVWPVLSKTDTLNRSLGLPPVKYEVKPLPGGGTEVMATARLLGKTLRWLELPFEWVEHEHYHVRRIFEGGPIAEAFGGMEFESAAEKGITRVRVHSSITPRNLAGALLARTILVPKTNRDMTALMEHVRQYLARSERVAMPKLPRSPINDQALERGLEKLRATQPSELLALFAELLRESPDLDLVHLRPFAVARGWGEDRWRVLRLFLHATRAGLLDLSWEVLCPNCRTPPDKLTNALAGIHRTVHCEACQIKFDAEFDKSVELKFAVNHAIRPGDRQIFCLSGPGAKPHIISQITLLPGQKRSWKLPSIPAPHRLRSGQVECPLLFRPEEVAGRVFACRREAFVESGKIEGAKEQIMEVMNPGTSAVHLVFERQEWDEDVLTAAQATNWQEFRDLFATEVISPHEQITIGEQIILFTDLRGSTALYCGIGDAPAYALVRDHFLILQNVVREHHGSVVKTIGDAVMAVFSRLREALLAVEQMHRQVGNAPSLQKRCLSLKSSLHAGPCLAVNANDRLDFFGTTINLAARMVDCCQGGDVTISDDLLARQETKDFLGEVSCQPQPLEVRFRGFDAPQKVWRIPLIKA